MEKMGLKERETTVFVLIEGRIFFSFDMSLYPDIYSPCPSLDYIQGSNIGRVNLHCLFVE